MSNQNEDQKMKVTAAEEEDQVEYLKALLAMSKAKKIPSKVSDYKLVTIIIDKDGGIIPVYRE